jgi:hypothetical protein
LVTITTGQSFVEYFQQGALLNAIGKSQNSLAFPQGVPGTFGLKPVVIVTNFGLKSVVPVVLLVLLVLLALLVDGETLNLNNSAHIPLPEELLMRNG